MVTTAQHTPGPDSTASASPPPIVGLLAELFLPRSSPTHALVTGADGEPFTRSTPLSHADLLAHLRGERRCGAIPCTDSTRVGWAAIDFDTGKHGLDPEGAAAHAVVARTLEALGASELVGWPERSKSKGWHIWLFFSGPVEARAVRRVLLDVLREVGWPIAADTVTPRSDTCSNAGNGVWLPLFGGDEGGRTCFAACESFEPADDQAAVLRAILANLNDPERVRELAEALADPSPGGNGCAHDSDGERPQRYTAEHPCPVCNGFERMPRGEGTRCHGYLFGRGAYCARVESERRHPSADLWWHRLDGEAGRERQAEAENGPPPLDLGALGFTGERLRAIRSRPVSVSPLPGILDPEPHLHLAAGRQKSGKTRFMLALARAWALGVAPWPKAPALPGGRVLVLSREQPVTRLDAMLRHLDEHAADGATGWEDRVVLLGRDPELSKAGRRLLTLDASVIDELRCALLGARAAGDPFGLVVLDSLSRLLPPGMDENDNGEVSQWLDALEALAIEAAAWVVLVHHVGHTDAPGRGEARSAGRGASAIGACAQVTLLLERVAGQPNQRRLAVDGNAVLPREWIFDTAEPDAEPGMVDFFRPADPFAAYDLDVLLPIAEPVSLSELAWRVSGETRKPGKRPSGAAQREARRLVGALQRAGHAETYEGERGADMVLRTRPEVPR